ncbi:MAG: single-stranded-DNA-specific exonuclease RecJ [Desulforhopalus sp.]|nr:single-stranded-DNA-specific exonuclease RecJ [Desulforhopalus sp.]
MSKNLSHQKANTRMEIPPVLRELLKKRGIEGDEELSRFLFPRLVDLLKPEKMQNLAAAANLVVEYMMSGKPIVIWGDYDVDGTTGTALLVNFFQNCGVTVTWHIPDRISEGYGLNKEWFYTFKKSLEKNDFLLITVDCGISNSAEINFIQEMGGKVIVTDHHSLPIHGLPNCLILNPAMPTCGFHKEQLAGVGVAFYLIARVRAELLTNTPFADRVTQINLKHFLAFVALGTIADMVELTSTNRILVRGGLEALDCTIFPGIQELLASCDIINGGVLSEDIGYLLGPKINAAGRLGESDLVVKMLTTSDRQQAKKMAVKLSALNEDRKRISLKDLETALTKTSKSKAENDKCVVVEERLHQGVAGIVASRLVEIYGFPAIVFAEKTLPDGSLVYVGSARSVEGINIIEILGTCANLIEYFGGHEMAAGLTVAAEKFPAFATDFTEKAKKSWNKRQFSRKKRYDIECPVENLMSDEFLTFLKLLEPYGPGNPQPIFQDSSAQIIDSRVIGKDAQHLNMTIRGKFVNLKGIGFSLGSRIHDVQKNAERTLIYTPTINRFRGNVSWQVRVIDV